MFQLLLINLSSNYLSEHVALSLLVYCVTNIFLYCYFRCQDDQDVKKSTEIWGDGSQVVTCSRSVDSTRAKNQENINCVAITKIYVVEKNSLLVCQVCYYVVNCVMCVFSSLTVCCQVGYTCSLGHNSVKYPPNCDINNEVHF